MVRRILSLNFINKTYIAITSLFYVMLTRFDFIMIYLFFAVFGIYMAINYKNKQLTLVSFYPFVVMSLIYFLRLLDDKINIRFL